jgi:hypothetical protein
VTRAEELRRRAEALCSRAETGGGRAEPGDVTALLHELSVHQVELELQHEELLRANANAEESRQKYYDLYDRAPVAYVTLAQDGTFVELNLTTARLLD